MGYPVNNSDTYKQQIAEIANGAINLVAEGASKVAASNTTPFLDAAITEAISSGKKIIIPAGSYRFDSPPAKLAGAQNTALRVTIAGDGYGTELVINYDGTPVTASTVADPTVITAVAHGKENDQEIRVRNVTGGTYDGATGIPDGTYVVKNKTADTFELYQTDGVTSVACTVEDPSFTNSTVDRSFLDFENVNFLHLENFRVYTANNTGPTLPNVTAVKLTGDPGSANGVMQNVYVFGMGTGLWLGGFIWQIHHFYGRNLGLGFKADSINAGDIQMSLERVEKGLEITGGSGTTFQNYLNENIVTDGTTVPSTIDGVDSIAFQNLYFEQQDRLVPYMVFGENEECRDVRIEGASISSGDNTAEAAGFLRYPIEFHDVDGLYFSCRSNGGRYKTIFSTTQGTRNVTLGPITGPANTIQDAGNALIPAINHFPNPRFDKWFSGWDLVITSSERVYIQRETSNVKTGTNALRITPYNVAATKYLEFRATKGDMMAFGSSKRVTVGAWIYVSDTANYDRATSGVSDALPNLKIDSTPNEVLVNSGGDSISHKPGEWNFYWATYDLPADLTRLNVQVWADTLSAATISGDYILVDSIYLIEGSDYMRIMNGNVVNSDAIDAIYLSHRMAMFDTAAPTGSVLQGKHQVYEIGDKIWDESPGSGATGMGWVALTAGAMSDGETRANSTAYTLNNIVAWDSGTTVWSCIVAGTSDSSAPSIVGKVEGDTVVDGGVTWLMTSLTEATWAAFGDIA